MQALTLRRSDRGTKMYRGKGCDAAKDVSSRVQLVSATAGQTDGHGMAWLSNDIEEHEARQVYSEERVGLVCLCDTACGNCKAVAGSQGFFTGLRVAPGEAADKVPVLSAREDQWGEMGD